MQTAHCPEQLKEELLAAGFTDVAYYGFLEKTPPAAECLRIQFAAKKPL